MILVNIDYNTYIKEFIKDNNINIIIDYNNRNIKDSNKIKIYIRKKKKKIYKQRNIVENSHAWKEIKIQRT